MSGRSADSEATEPSCCNRPGSESGRPAVHPERSGGAEGNRRPSGIGLRCGPVGQALRGSGRVGAGTRAARSPIQTARSGGCGRLQAGRLRDIAGE